jgi:hypothetical protein
MIKPDPQRMLALFRILINRKMSFYIIEWYGVLQNSLVRRHFFPQKRYKTKPVTLKKI